MADVVLDPFPVGGGRSSLEVFAVGTPIVMLYNRTSILQVPTSCVGKRVFARLSCRSPDMYLVKADPSEQSRTVCGKRHHNELGYQ